MSDREFLRACTGELNIYIDFSPKRRMKVSHLVKVEIYFFRFCEGRVEFLERSSNVFILKVFLHNCTVA